MGTRRQFCKISFRHIVGPLASIRPVKTRLAYVRGDQASDGAFKAGKRLARLGKLALDRDIRDRDVFVVHARILCQPRIVAFKVGFGFERQIPRHARDLLMPAGIGREVDCALTEPVALDCGIQRLPQYACFNLRCSIKSGRRNSIKAGKEFAGLGCPAVLRGERIIAKFIAIVVDAERARIDRLFLQHERPDVIDQFRDVFVGIGIGWGRKYK